jgi:hypothetical protein
VAPKSKKYILLSVLPLVGGMIASRLGASAIGFVSLATIAFLWIQFKSSSITLDDEGFTHKSLGRSSSYKWTEIKAAEGFFIVTQRVNFVKVNSFVGWNFDSSYRKAKIARAFSGVVLGTEAMIDPLGHDAKDLAILMTEFMHRSYARAGPMTRVVA